MAREHENFRLYLEQLNNIYPGREYLCRKEVAAFCNCCEKTVDRKFKAEKTDFGIDKVALAKRLCTLLGSR